MIRHAFLLSLAIVLSPAWSFADDGGSADVSVAAPVATPAMAPDGGSAVVARPTDVPAIVPGHEIEWVVDVIHTLRDLARSNRWGPFSSLILMALASVGVWTKMKFGKGWSAELATDITMVISILTFVGFQLGLLAVGAKAGDWFAAISSGIMTGAGAVGLWSWVGKRLFDRFLHPQPATPGVAPADPSAKE